MGLTALVSGILRGTAEERNIEVNEKGELLTAQGLLPYTEMTRRYEGWSAIATSAAAAVAVRPTTTAGITLYNGEPQNGKSYIIDRIFTHCLVSGAEEGRFSIWACSHPVNTAVPATGPLAAAVNQKNGNRGGLYTGLSVFDVGDTCIDQGWYPWGYSTDMEPTGVLPGAAIDVRVEGRLIVPPTAALSVQIVTSVNDETFCSGISWYEVKLDI